jgi:hypothetical protein
MRLLKTSGAYLVTAISLLATKGVNADPGPRFPPNAVWNQDISAAPLNPNSSDIITHATTHGDWGTNFFLDFPFYVLHATDSTPTDVVADIGSYSGDCDPVGFNFPLPAGGGTSGTGPAAGLSSPPSYSCVGDCYLLVVKDNTLYESWQSTVFSGELKSACALAWDLGKVYPHRQRGEQCGSTVVSGTPIAPLLFNADDMYIVQQAAGADLGHAMRFLFGASSQSTYVHPASSGGSGGDTSADAIPMGARLRLRADYPVDTFVAGNVADGGDLATSSAKILLKTLQKYGMILTDNGSLPLTAESDYFTTHKWTEFGMDPSQDGYHLLKGVLVSDFEVVYTGDPITVTHDCSLIPSDFLFIDNYDF